jgi:glycosyltransferase involved in cell wall biosynthesis
VTGDLHVGIDVSPLALTRAGTARYLTSILAALADEPNVHLSQYDFGGSGRPTRIARDAVWYLGVLPHVAARDGVDVLHCPTFRAPVRASVPLVVTFHDLAVLRHPASFNAWSRHYGRVLLPRVARRADAVIAVSKFTRRELIELLTVPEEKIHVVPNGVGHPFRAGGPAADGQYVLAVSTLEPRKNLPTLVEGFRRASLDGWELRIVGARGWGHVRPEGKSVRMLGEVGDAELARLYRGAGCVAYLSLYEGFGLPVLEAMASGAPVVTSCGGACEELAADAAVLVDALAPDAIAAGLIEAIERGDELRRRGRERAAAFDWRRTAAETLCVYRKAAA